MISDSYQVEIVHAEAIKQSPENDDIYGEVTRDEQMESLIESIQKRGLEEPIIVSADDYVISGHRRLYACRCAGFTTVPVRRKDYARADHLDEWHTTLAEYNPQRIKTPLTLLKEAMLKRRDEDPLDLLENWEESIANPADAEFTKVDGFKPIGTVSDQRLPFLKAATKAIDKLTKYWPLTVRQVHYTLLNNPPLTRVCKRSSKDPEEARYKNDLASYKKLVRLLKDARYTGLLPLSCIDDPTRPMHHYRGYRNLSSFIESEMEGFLVGYHRDRQVDQPRHIELLGEKNTLMPILKPVATEYYVPLSLSRGYGTVPLWKQIADRYKRTCKKSITLVVVSDYDPEGLDLPKDAVRALRDVFGVPVDYHRVAVNMEQIEELALETDFNPAKEESSRLESFIEETGGTDTWECEAIPPDYLQDQVRAAIEANMDMDVYRMAAEQEQMEAEELSEIRSQIVDDLEF